MVPSAAKENDQLSQNFEAQDVESSVQTPRTNVPAAEDRLRIHHQRSEELSNEIQMTKACESVGCMRSVSLEPKEVDSLVQTQERNDEAVENRFKSLTNWRKRFNSRKHVHLRVSEKSLLGCSTKTFTMYDRGVQRIHVTREDPNSKIIVWDEGHTKFGPVLQVRT